MHKYRSSTLLILSLALLAGASTGRAQLVQVPSIGPTVGELNNIGSSVLDNVERPLGRLPLDAGSLASERLGRLRSLVRAHRDLLELTQAGPAVRGELVAVDPAPSAVQSAIAAGFTMLGEERIEGLDMHIVRLAVPRGMAVDEAVRRLGRIAPGAEFTADHLHLPSGAVPAAVAAAALATGGSGRPTIGIIDGGVAAHPTIAGADQHGFADGAPSPSAHGTAVASLAVGVGAMHGAAPGALLLVADVYGRDPRGGNAVAIARALGLMAQRGVRVVNMSIVGPANPLVAKAIAQVQARGITIVAPVGNDGPAAPSAYPASYPGVIAVTGVDGRDRPLIEAGKALHLDFAAPGADMVAASPDGALRPVRGTSFAAPLVAGLLARKPLPALESEAIDLGPKGPDRSYGRGLVCGACRTPLPKK
jgi:minor extracellular protease Epr